jgi:hypothetical protein
MKEEGVLGFWGLDIKMYIKIRHLKVFSNLKIQIN